MSERRAGSGGITVAVRVSYPEKGGYSWVDALRPFVQVGAVEVAFKSPCLFLNTVELREVVAPFSRVPIQVAAVHMAHARITEADIFTKTLEKTVHIAEALDCCLIVVHPSRGQLSQVEKLISSKIDPLLERAEVSLCWETFESKKRFLSGIEGIAAFCMGRERHAVCYDTSHLHKPQAEVLVDIGAHINLIQCFHLSNRAEASSRPKQHLPLRHPEGELDFALIVRKIREHNFQGVLTLEYLREYHDWLVEDALWVKGILGMEKSREEGNAGCR